MIRASPSESKIIPPPWRDSEPVERRGVLPGHAEVLGQTFTINDEKSPTGLSAGALGWAATPTHPLLVGRSQNFRAVLPCTSSLTQFRPRSTKRWLQGAFLHNHLLVLGIGRIGLAYA